MTSEIDMLWQKCQEIWPNEFRDKAVEGGERKPSDYERIELITETPHSSFPFAHQALKIRVDHAIAQHGESGLNRETRIRRTAERLHDYQTHYRKFANYWEGAANAFKTAELTETPDITEATVGDYLACVKELRVQADALSPLFDTLFDVALTIAKTAANDPHATNFRSQFHLASRVASFMAKDSPQQNAAMEAWIALSFDIGLKHPKIAKEALIKEFSTMETYYQNQPIHTPATRLMLQQQIEGFSHVQQILRHIDRLTHGRIKLNSHPELLASQIFERQYNTGLQRLTA